jgi:hypothetical protein
VTEFVLSIFFLLTSCSSHVDKLAGQNAPKQDAGGGVVTASQKATYSWIKANVIGPSCIGCHSKGKSASDYPFESYNDVADPANTVVATNDPENSYFYTDIRDGMMPKHRAHLPADQVQAVFDWIKAGCPNN